MNGIQYILSLYTKSKSVSKLTDILANKRNSVLHIKGLTGSSVTFAVYSVQKNLSKPMLCVFPREEEAALFFSDLQSIAQNKDIYLFPSSYTESLGRIRFDIGNIQKRAEAVSALYSKQPPEIIVTYAEALAECVITNKDIQNALMEIKQGANLMQAELHQFMSQHNFELTDYVYQAGQYAVRGSIIDVFSFSNDMPYRIELYGNTVEEIRLFNPETQLSTEYSLSQCTIMSTVQSNTKANQRELLLNHLSEETFIFIKDGQYFTEILTGIEETFQHKLIQTEENNLETIAFASFRKLKELLLKHNILESGRYLFIETEPVVPFSALPQPSFNKNFNLLHQQLTTEYKDLKKFIFSSNENQIKRLESILTDLSQKDKTADSKDIPLFYAVNLDINQGFIDKQLGIACYTDHQIFNRVYRRNMRKVFTKKRASTLSDLQELKEGDFVTHIDYGIGKYKGLRQVNENGRTVEKIRLEYQDGIVEMNIGAIGRISKFSGQNGKPPKINKIDKAGVARWEEQKQNVKKRVKDIARDLIMLYARRKSRPGFAFSPDSYPQTELEASFLYEDTPDQQKATIDVKKDMEAPHPMDRLICGDVGFGKTEIAIRAAFKAVTDGKQVAVLVPTTILAAQHFQTFTKRLEQFPCTIDYLSSFKSAKQSQETIKRLAEGKIDILIGTHAIIGTNVKFKDLGLLIIDEEQKFGVKVKEQLKTLRTNVDTLTLTATPIPRTLHFSMMGARDLSLITTPPPNRLPVETGVQVFNEKVIKDAIEFELSRGGQVFFVHNRIQNIEQIAELVRKLCPSARVAVGHRELKNKLEHLLSDFIDGQYDVLIATTIIETGIDVPNANTIIINDAQMFGLSDLHQMRGRVGRSNKKAFCYLLTPPIKQLTDDARKRLTALEEFSDLGSGFNIAMRDLDIRGSGNLLGSEQSGFMENIGFELYHKILDEAVLELKEDEFTELFKNETFRPVLKSNTVVDVDQETILPISYILGNAERAKLYKELFELEEYEAIDAFILQIEDRFGKMPASARNLIQRVKMKILAEQIGFEKIVFKNKILKCDLSNRQKQEKIFAEQLDKVINFVQRNSTKCALKEIAAEPMTLQLSISDVQTMEEATAMLEEISQINK